MCEGCLKNTKEEEAAGIIFQFKDMVQALAASLSVGYSFENAFIAAHEELTRTYGKDALIVRELVVIMHEIRLHKNIEDVLADFGERSGIREIHNFPNWLLWQKDRRQYGTDHENDCGWNCPKGRSGNGDCDYDRSKTV